jgi:ABC-type transporter Mla subunit MlaD
LQEQAGTVQPQFGQLTQQLKAESANLKAGAEKARSASDTRLARLEELVERVARDAQTSRQVIETYKSDIDKIKVAAAAEVQRFGANAEYTVSVLYFPHKRGARRKSSGRTIKGRLQGCYG